jgi:plastocyanin
MVTPYLFRCLDRRWSIALAAGAGVIMLAACGSTGSVGSASPAGTPAGSMPGMHMPKGAAPPGRAVAANTVAIKNFTFAPAAVTVRAGTTVTWKNTDEEPHTVSATGGPFHSGTLNTGATYRYTFTKPGQYRYLCTIHPFMHGTVVVTR